VQTKPTHNYLAVETIIHSDINRIKGCHSRESGNPEKHWIPPYQVRGRLSQARNDKYKPGRVGEAECETHPERAGR
jgi:hypothetical protein